MAKILKGATAQETHSAILDLIRSSGTATRVELAQRSGLTAASISRVVKQLLADGLIVETGPGDPTGGKRATLLQFNPRARHAVGISIDTLSITYVITDMNGRVIEQLASRGIGRDTPATAIKRIVNELEDLIHKADVEPATLVGVGVALAGRQGAGESLLRSRANRYAWEPFAVMGKLSGAIEYPVVVENDSTCAAIGEFWAGRIPSVNDFATVYLAAGFGLGLVTNGDVYRGSSSNVGEIGHMVLDVKGPSCWCGGFGCLEALAAPARVVFLAGQDDGLVRDLGLHGRNSAIRADFAKIARGAVAGDQRCLALIEKSAWYLAKALLSITNLLDLSQIILAGPGFSEAGEIYARVASNELGRLSFVRAMHSTRVELSKLGPSAAALGAASLVLHSRLTPHQTSNRALTS
ncbi:putative NBD/HSP70 family sugar kinase [Kribbella sp. VKM Ac-2527]|uniref:Putative NBD/HSP70 family sugar kinase n=1 Tax=Kribbella caucasensis TaxID=2512215 RepID=A0A4R6KDZ2_9ACTN|nr:ROK family transcriptional regulator [Kribbella sp. VKM Ac-2527]TDO47811.1 putative NBD/HSP70 family sugar kinase [Kribbella sp. VKM Ac-2527]